MAGTSFALTLPYITLAMYDRGQLRVLHRFRDTSIRNLFKPPRLFLCKDFAVRCARFR